MGLDAFGNIVCYYWTITGDDIDRTFETKEDYADYLINCLQEVKKRETSMFFDLDWCSYYCVDVTPILDRFDQIDESGFGGTYISRAVDLVRSLHKRLCSDKNKSKDDKPSDGPSHDWVVWKFRDQVELNLRLVMSADQRDKISDAIDKIFKSKGEELQVLDLIKIIEVLKGQLSRDEDFDDKVEICEEVLNALRQHVTHVDGSSDADEIVKSLSLIQTGTFFENLKEQILATNDDSLKDCGIIMYMKADDDYGYETSRDSCGYIYAGGSCVLGYQDLPTIKEVFKLKDWPELVTVYVHGQS